MVGDDGVAPGRTVEEGRRRTAAEKILPGIGTGPAALDADAVDRVREQIARSGEALPAAAIDEYRKALKIYEEIAGRAR